MDCNRPREALNLCGSLLPGDGHVLDQHRSGFDVAAVIDVVGYVDDMLKHVPEVGGDGNFFDGILNFAPFYPET